MAITWCLSPVAVKAEDSAEISPGLGDGICVMLGTPGDGQPESVIDFLDGNALQVFFQSPDTEQVEAVRRLADRRGVLGKRLYVEQGDLSSIHLANNVADRVIVSPQVQNSTSQGEVLRVLHPEGTAIFGKKRITKPKAEGVNDWSHVYHGPDNNPQSTDQIARAPYRTQFLADLCFRRCPK